MTEVQEFPVRRGSPFVPPEVYAAWTAAGPVHPVRLPNGNRAFVITRHQQAREVLTDQRFSSDMRKPGFPSLSASEGAPVGQELAELAGAAPGDATVSIKKMTSGEFTVRRMERLRPRIEEIVETRLDQLLAGPKPVDLVQALALPVPTEVICELLGVPYADHGFFQQRSTTMLDHLATADQRSAATYELWTYLSELIGRKLAEPTDDLLGRHISANQESGAEVDTRLLAGLSMSLLVAGHETSASMIALGTLAFLRHTDQRDAVIEEPDRMPAAVEELLRVFSIADTAVLRVTTEDLEVAGTPVPAGSGVIVLTNAANHDPSVFPNPDDVDVCRELGEVRQHLAFGYGFRQCVGQHLARIELQTVFSRLLARIPDLRLAVPVEQLRFNQDALIFAPEALPVTWPDGGSAAAG